MDMVEVNRAMDKAKIALMSRPDSVFFTELCFSLKHKWDTSIPTAATNGLEIRTNPKFFMELDVEERVFLMLHETMHVAYLHMDRLQTRDRQKWNVAADHVINIQLLDRGFTMPKGGLADYRYAGMTTEEVYAILLDEEMPDDFEGDLEDCPTPSEELTEQVKDALVRAATRSKAENDAIGTIPGELQVYLDKLLNPKLPWNRILQKYLNALAKNDYTFQKPNRRFFPKHYLPSLRSQRLIDIEVAVDISGSVTDHEFRTFVSEVTSIFKMMKPEKITLVQFDTEIKSVTPLKNINELLQVKFIGRGGTRIEPVMDRATRVKPQLLLVFTDGKLRFHENGYKVNMLWLIHNNPKFEAPYGKVLHYSIEKS